MTAGKKFDAAEAFATSIWAGGAYMMVHQMPFGAGLISTVLIVGITSYAIRRIFRVGGYDGGDI